jgi:hypothetical protein
MTVAITQPIKAASVVEKDALAHPQIAVTSRPETLHGKTYKVKTPLSEHALYVTINDHDSRPFEIFINSKAMEHFQWIVGMTRMISMVFRQSGNLETLTEEMRSVFDPKGGYFKKGGKFMPSLVAEIGDIIERHCTDLGLIERDMSLIEAAKAMVNEKMKNADEKPERACPECGGKAVVMDGCLTCVECGYSKCG